MVLNRRCTVNGDFNSLSFEERAGERWQVRPLLSVLVILTYGGFLIMIKVRTPAFAGVLFKRFLWAELKQRIAFFSS
jgi:hypothetical protein